MANLYSVPLENGVQLTLQNALLTGQTSTITFTGSVTAKLQASSAMPGILVIDRVDANGNETPTKTEYISFTGVTGSTVTGLVRALSNTTDQDHAAGAIVELVPDVVWAEALNDVFTTQHNSDGTHKTLSLISLASVTINNSIINSASFTDFNLAGGTLASSTIYNSKFTGLNIETTTFTGGSLVSITTANMATIPVHTKTITSPASAIFNLSASNIFSYNLSVATTALLVTSPTAGQPFVVRLSQGSAGNRAVFFDTIKWAGGTAPTLTATLNKTDVFGFLCTASGFYDGYIVGQNL
jgi:hypothetical protein